MNQSHTTEPLLNIRGLRKQYGEVEVLKGVDLSMQRDADAAIRANASRTSRTASAAVPLAVESPPA